MKISREDKTPVGGDDKPPDNVREINKIFLKRLKLFIYIWYVYNSALTITFVCMSSHYIHNQDLSTRANNFEGLSRSVHVSDIFGMNNVNSYSC